MTARFTFCAAVLAACLALPLSAQTLLRPDEARRAAAVLLVQGHPRAALDMVEALISRDPKDAASLTVRAHAQRTLKQYKAAQQSARAAWRYSETDAQKFAAARAMAQALSSDGRKLNAQLWLRRAIQVAPDRPTRLKAESEYRFVRVINPLSVQFRFGITPSDNVNNAPRDNTIVLGGLLFVNESAIPLSGIETEVGATLRYNFNISQTRRDFAQVSWDQTHVHITDDDKPETVTDSNFRYTKLETTIGRDFKQHSTAPNRTVSLSLGRIWYGMQHLSDELRGEFRQTQSLNNNTSLTWYTNLGYAERQDSDLRSGTTSTLGATWNKTLSRGDRFTVMGVLSRSNTDSAVITHSALTLGATYTLSKPVLGAIASLSAYGTVRRYDDAVYGPDPRADERAVLSTSLLFKGFDTYGFAPKVSLTVERNNSNIENFDTRQIGINIGFQSVF